MPGAPDVSIADLIEDHILEHLVDPSAKQGFPLSGARGAD